jgi:8-oxo-dGTP pyrophosphatase MutT (NUDIX family)
MRGGKDAPEILLLKRVRSAGFVPGAWVFPGGRVDTGDSGPALYERIRGLPRDPEPQAAYWAAALRELFEETGVLLARNADGVWAPDAASDRRLASLRHALMDDAAALMDVLDDLDLTLDASGTVHIAHWITPVVEPRRYDTHFFAAELPDGREVAPDPREMTEAAWLGPVAALERFEQGDLPMVFPTVKTLESLARYESAGHALDALRHAPVARILPRLVRTATGVAIVIDRDPR